MPQLFTFRELRQVGRSIDAERILRSASTGPDGKTVLLSHSLEDRQLLPAVISILEEHGARVYVDLNDQRLPATPSAETGAILRETIIRCPKFVIFVTTNSKDSRWIPWELGIADGDKTADHVALFPSAETSDDQSWTDREYLGIYRRIVLGHLQGKPRWMVYSHHDSALYLLRDWLASE